MIPCTLLATVALGTVGLGLVLAGRWLRPRLGARIALGVTVLSLLPFFGTPHGEVRLFSGLLSETSNYAFRFDALARLFAGLSGLFVVALLLWMALGAREEEAQAAPWLLLFQAVFLHLLGTGNLLVLYASWEALIFLTYLFLGQRRADLPTPGIAERFLGIQHLAGYPMLGALLLIHQRGGTLTYGSLSAGDVPPEALVLLLGTMWVRMAQVPFQGWLVSTARAPDPADALLQGGWLLLTGPYAWLRLLSRAAAPGPQEAALIVGSISLLLGAVLAMHQETGRRVLAGDTVARMGLLWMALGLGGAWGTAAGLFLLVDLVAGKLLFHLAYAGTGVLDGTLRRAFYALGMWGALGFPPSAGLVGRWLLALGLLLAGRLPYLTVVLLASPFLLAALWRGWSFVPAPEEALEIRVGHRIGLALGLGVPLSGLLAPLLWRASFERATLAAASASALLIRATLLRLGGWLPGFLLLLFLLGVGAAWCGCFRRRGRPALDPTASGPLREVLAVLARDTAWLAWMAQPAGLDRALAQLGHALAARIDRGERFLERHTTYFLLFVLIAAGAAVVVLTR